MLVLGWLNACLMVVGCLSYGGWMPVSWWVVVFLMAVVCMSSGGVLYKSEWSNDSLRVYVVCYPVLYDTSTDDLSFTLIFF